MPLHKGNPENVHSVGQQDGLAGNKAFTTKSDNLGLIWTHIVDR